jgi:hypothetical protein
MSITAFSQFSRSGRIMFWALLSSLVLHLWLLFMPPIDLTLPRSSDPKGIDADLVTILKVRISEAPVAVPPQPQPQSRKESGGRRNAAAAVTPASVPESAAPAAVAEVGAGPAPPEAAAAEEAAAAGEGVTPAPEAINPEAAIAAESAPEPHPPLKVTVEYALHKGSDGLKVGKVMHTWQISDGRYVISSVMEATGVFALLKRGMFVQSSQGRITANGLEPESYWEQRGQEADRTYNAQFDYTNQTLTYGRVAESTTVALPPGTQDQLSFAYQFALRAPFDGTLQFSMTNGRKLGNYSYQVVGEEVIKTELGELRTLRLSKVRKQPDDDSVDLWLAVDHQYLPVKARITNSDGDVAEQVVEGIQSE